MPQRDQPAAARGSEDPTVFGSFLLDLAVSLTVAEKGSLWLRDDVRQDLHIFCSVGIPADIAGGCRTRPGEGIAGLVARRRRPVFVPFIEKDKRFDLQRCYSAGPPSFIACPIISRNRVLGLLTLSGKNTGDPFTKSDYSLIRLLIEQSAVPFNHYFRSHSLPESAGMAEIGERLACLGGEWRNRLHSIHGAVYYLRTSGNPISKEQEDFLAIIGKETRKLIQLTNTNFGLKG